MPSYMRPVVQAETPRDRRFIIDTYCVRITMQFRRYKIIVAEWW